MHDDVRIVGADISGLTLAQGKSHWFESWDAVDGILLARVEWGNTTALAAAIAIGGGERCVIAYQPEARWETFLEAAHDALPGMIPREQWEPKLVKVTRGLYIYERSPLPRANIH